MLTWEDDVEVHALRKRGWSISAVARHTGRGRKTVRAYLAGGACLGCRARPGPHPRLSVAGEIRAYRLSIESRVAGDR